MNYATRSALGYTIVFLSLSFSLLVSLLYFCKQVHRQTRLNRYYIVLRARVALAGRKREEESFYISRRPGLGTPCVIKRREKSRARFSAEMSDIDVGERISLERHTTILRRV